MHTWTCLAQDGSETQSASGFKHAALCCFLQKCLFLRSPWFYLLRMIPQTDTQSSLWLGALLLLKYPSKEPHSCSNYEKDVFQSPVELGAHLILTLGVWMRPWTETSTLFAPSAPWTWYGVHHIVWALLFSSIRSSALESQGQSYLTDKSGSQPCVCKVVVWNEKVNGLISVYSSHRVIKLEW